MADTKISALTASTTPLAGTEVLPIVQSGTTKQVSVDNLTAGRAVSMSSVTATATGLFGGSTRVSGSAAIVEIADTGVSLINSVAAGQNNWSLIKNTASLNQSNIEFSTGVGVSLTLNHDKTATFTDNLIQGTAAKGINFTANTPAAGMTSQLLNWYEEGTWTPGQGGGVTVVGSFSSSGTYTRIGRQVTVNFTMAGSTSIAINGGGYSFATGLPFAGSSGVWFPGSCINSSATLSTNPFVLDSTVYSAEAIPAVAAVYVTITYKV